MMNQRAFAEYQQTAAVGASALRQVVALYETILRDLRRAMTALQQGDIEKRVFEVNHALLVLTKLQSALDFEQGGEAAKKLSRFYDVCRAEIFEASVAPSREKLQRLMDLFTPVYQAWEQVSRELPSTPAREAMPDTRIQISSTLSTPGSMVENTITSLAPCGRVFSSWTCSPE